MCLLLFGCFTFCSLFFHQEAQVSVQEFQLKCSLWSLKNLKPDGKVEPCSVWNDHTRIKQSLNRRDSVTPSTDAKQNLPRDTPGYQYLALSLPRTQRAARAAYISPAAQLHPPLLHLCLLSLWVVSSCRLSPRTSRSTLTYFRVVPGKTGSPNKQAEAD